MRRILSLFSILILSQSLMAQKDGNYKGFDFFNLKPTEKVWIKSRGSYSYIRNDSLIKVSFYNDFEKYVFNIVTDEIPYSTNTDFDCCTGDADINRRFYFPDSIIEFNYFHANPMYIKVDERDKIVLRSKRIITKDSILVNYFNKNFVLDSSLEKTCRTIEKSIDELELKRWKKYTFHKGYKNREVTLEASGSSKEKIGFLYFGCDFEQGWWSEWRFLVSYQNGLMD
tara:strand:- start:586 stop:1266 length:681 start_codon:yes stop_codon:yes gene_type:complete